MKTGLLCIALLGGFLGCQGPRAFVPETPSRPSLLLDPAEACVTVDHARRFNCAVRNGGPGEVVVWEVLEPSGGSVDPSGRYKAPLRAGEYTLQAGLRSGPPTVRARIKVVAPPDGNITAPGVVTRGASGLRASVPLVPGSRYEWGVRGGRVLEGGATAAMVFEAGAEAKVLLVCKVTNAAGDVLNSSLEIPMAAPVALSISPLASTLTVGRDMKFGFDIQGGASSRVRWSLGAPGSGTVDAAGRYTAPGEPGLYQVLVASEDDPLAVAMAQVKVVAEPRGAILAPATAEAGATTLVASITPQEGMTYAWEISGGSIQGATGPVLTFAVGTGPRATLKCRIQNEAHDSLLVTRELIVTP